MPTVTLNRNVFEKLVGKKLSDEQLKDRISMLGTALESLSTKDIVVEVFPNRPDMLSEQGFARAFAAFLGTKTGLKEYPTKKSGTHTVIEKTLSIWPHAVTCIVKGLELNDERIREIIQLQEKLGVTLLRNRKKGGLGIYPLEKITFPIKFTTRKAEDIIFRPLEHPKKTTGREILKEHPTGRRYAHIIEKQKEFPIFVDAKGTIMSMPPIINSHDLGKITETTKDVFIEATGPDKHTLIVALNIFVTALADMGGVIYTMDIMYQKEKETIPDLTPKNFKIDVSYTNKILGLKLKETDLKPLLNRMGYEYKNKTVLVPAYRADILHPIDIVEDIAIAYGFENFEAEIPKVATVAEEKPLHRFITILLELLTGAGCQEVKSYHLLSEEELCKNMNCSIPTIPLKNAPADYTCIRNSILPSLMKILAQNQHNDYPQHICEFGTTFFHDKEKETGVHESNHCCIALCDEKADLTTIRQVIDMLGRALACTLTIIESDNPSFIKGRVAEAHIDGKKIAIFGEIAPQVLESWGLIMPVAAAEIDVDALFEAVQNIEKNI